MGTLDKGEWIRTLEPISGITRTTLSERIYQSLMEAILTGKIGPGEHLVEQKVADQFGVSRMAAREAVRKLASDGLVDVIPNRGMFTLEFSEGDIREIFSLRTVLESLAVRILAERGRRSDLALLAEIIAEMTEVEQSRDRVAAALIDTRFHRRLVELSEHTRLIRTWQSMRAQIMMVVYTSSTHYTEIGNLAERHQMILDPLLAGDAAQASQTIVHHIEDAGEYLLACLARERR